MNIYLINALLVLLVVRQIREHQLDLRALAVPVLAVGAAAVMFLHSVPGGGKLTSRWTCSACPPARPWARPAAWLRTCGPARDGLLAGPRLAFSAASMWIAGVGARMVFYFAATHGAWPLPGSASRTTSPAPAPGPPRWS